MALAAALIFTVAKKSKEAAETLLGSLGNKALDNLCYLSLSMY